MQLLLPFVALLPLAACRSLAGVTPLEKVIQLLEDMTEQGKKELHDEQVQYASYAQFCNDTADDTTAAIAQAEMEITMLQADIEAAETQAETMHNEIAEHERDIAQWDSEQKAATEIRNTEQSDYEALHKDYSESVFALERAIATLKAQDYSRAQASLAQISKMPLVPAKAKRSLELFLAQGVQAETPEAYAYEFQSGHIIDLLEDLLVRFRDERTAIEKQEMNAKHDYDVLMQDLAAQTERANADIQQKTAVKASSLESKAQNEGTLSETSATKAEDEGYLSDLTALCNKKAADFANRQQLRTDELNAIERAVAVLSDTEVKGAAEKHLPTLVSVKRAALASLRASAAASAQGRVHEFLQQQAQRLNSQVMVELANQVRDDDPFGKVRQMIQDLIVRLEEEANAEASHKEWCDGELASNEKTRKEKSEQVELLTAEIERLEASIAKLNSTIKDLNVQVSELDESMMEATSFRANESATNNVTVQEAKAAQVAVEEAMAILKDFYKTASNATSLSQAKQQPVAPKIFEDPYQGMQAEHGGVQGMLEVIHSDFARLEADTVAAEVAALEEYQKFMHESEVDKTAKSKDIEYKTVQMQEEDQELVTAKSDLEGTQQELDAALEYYETLKPSCVDASVSYEDRVGRREAEIESLQEALRILNGETIGEFSG